MRIFRFLLIMLLPLAGCYASASVGVGGAGVLVRSIASFLIPNNVIVTYVDHCVDSAKVISSGEPGRNLWIYRGKPVVDTMYAGGDNKDVVITLLGFNRNVYVGTAVETFSWQNEDYATWFIGNTPSPPRHHSVITNSANVNVCS